ncbi:MAG: MoxR family ATPase [Eubacterium sp.]|nr:MoxR family ATPase [Eubacterium sp.]
MELKDIRALYLKVLDNIKSVMIGSEEVSSLIFSSMLAGGHVLLEDNPGTGKTTMAKVIAESINGEFRRIQFTPDLMPQDITGLNIFSQKDDEFHLVKGPVFTNILLADEINRATPRTQSALLQAMEERMVTIDGDDMDLIAPFIVIATENPLETTGTFPLPEAQLDRFTMKLTMGELSLEDETRILERFIHDEPLKAIKPVAEASEIVDASIVIRSVTVKKLIMSYITGIADATRRSSKIYHGVSPRASLSLMRVAQAFAAISGRDYVTPDDVRFLAPYVFAHRIIPSSGSTNILETRKLVGEVAGTVEVPVEDWKN